MLRSLVLILSLGFATQAFAGDIPSPGSRDNRVRYVDYHKDAVIIVYVQPGSVTRLVLEDDEQILVAATGISADCQTAEAAWCVRADQGTNEIWIKPKGGAGRNNLELRTNHRDYSIEFKVGSGAETRTKHRVATAAQPMYRVIFRYPVELPSLSQFMAGTVANPQVTPEALLAQRLSGSHIVPRHWNYTQQSAKDSEDIRPSIVFDDGRFTYFGFAAHKDMPTVFYLNPSGEEERVNTHIVNDLLVVERLGKRFVLRLGRSVVGTWNETTEPSGVPDAVTGTSVPGVTRTVK